MKESRLVEVYDEKTDYKFEIMKIILILKEVKFTLNLKIRTLLSNKVRRKTDLNSFGLYSCILHIVSILVRFKDI